MLLRQFYCPDEEIGDEGHTAKSCTARNGSQVHLNSEPLMDFKRRENGNSDVLRDTEK